MTTVRQTVLSFLPLLIYTSVKVLLVDFDIPTFIDVQFDHTSSYLCHLHRSAHSTMPTTVINVYDTDSKEYKKAKRKHLKSTRGRGDQVESDWTPFRAAEKKFKAKFPPPDLSGVLDLALLDSSRADEVALGGWKGSLDAVEYREVELLSDDEKGKGRAYVFPQVPGASWTSL